MTLPAITRQGSKILLHTKHASLFFVSVGNKEKKYSDVDTSTQPLMKCSASNCQMETRINFTKFWVISAVTMKRSVANEVFDRDEFPEQNRLRANTTAWCH
jgi:hypothetical protein